MNKHRALHARLKLAAENMDWQQVVLNGGPPCFHLEDNDRFCGRAERWHNAETDKMFHRFTPFVDLLQLTFEEGLSH